MHVDCSSDAQHCLGGCVSTIVFMHTFQLLELFRKRYGLVSLQKRDILSFHSSFVSAIQFCYPSHEYTALSRSVSQYFTFRIVFFDWVSIPIAKEFKCSHFRSDVSSWRHLTRWDLQLFLFRSGSDAAKNIYETGCSDRFGCKTRCRSPWCICSAVS